ncbi:hypothetical protein JQ607_08050 [Bradyrhizobium liaoningense]|uniref:hypothetical protein n=1 Tax=Bradyrhizobium liaoningense TaxID=43992 RepID=UPI001BA84696|nr:hypothetical protein [Bradyrhizobium liaoningense]MBR0840146.1 hypothetical protein [Bradyrhizobium liaoningense]MBR0854287.1 hypothetical protein [Bradyrhizobium liaoningense]
MTGIGTDGHADTQAQSPAPQSSLSRMGGEQAIGIAFLLTSTATTLGWFYALSEGAMAIANWLMS